METQCRKILDHLKQGHSITPLEALQLFGCFRLGARIYDLKQAGHPIKGHFIELENGKRVKRYSL